MSRRAYGTGSVYQTASGRWVGAHSFVDADGKRHRRTVSGTSERAVRQRLRQLVSSETSHQNGSETLAEYLARWLREVAPSRVRGSTLKAYERVIRKQVVPVLGNLRLTNIGADDIQRLNNSGDVSPGTKRLAYRVLGAALQHAYRAGAIPSNPARLVPAPRVPRRPLDPWAADEARRFLDGTRGTGWWPLWVLAITTGMRQGELLGLRWEDVTDDTIRVQRNIRQVSRYVYEESEPKTARSRRTLPLAALAREALGGLNKGETEGYVFKRADGRPWSANSVREAFRSEAIRLGLRPIRFHGLRHTAASLLLDASGGDLRMVQSQLGHESIHTTVDIYGGRAEASRQRAAALMDGALARGTV